MDIVRPTNYKEFKVKVYKMAKLKDVIYNMLTFDRANPHDVVIVGKSGNITYLDFLRESVGVRTDIGMINLNMGVEGLENYTQIAIEPNTVEPHDVVNNLRDAAIKMWFERNGTFFRIQTRRLKLLCEKYPEYRKHYGRYFGMSVY